MAWRSGISSFHSASTVAFSREETHWLMRAQVEGETKVSKLPKLDATLGSETPGGPGQTKELEQLENLRQMFVAMTDDYRITLCRNQISGAPRHRRDVVLATVVEVHGGFSQQFSDNLTHSLVSTGIIIISRG